MEQKNKTASLSLIILIGFFSAVTFHYIAWTYYQNADWKTFLDLPIPSFAFSDFTAIHHSSKELNPYTGGQPNWGGIYFPFTYIAFYPLSQCSFYVAITCYSLLFMVALIYFNYRFIGSTKSDLLEKIQTTFIFSILTYPTLYSFERGNAENMVFVFCSFFLLCYINKQYILAAILLGLGASMKGYAGIFLFLFVFDRRWKEAFIVCATSGIATFGSMLIFQDSIIMQLTDLLANMEWFKGHFKTITGISPNNSSIFDFFRIFFYPRVENHDSVLLFYGIGAATFLSLMLLMVFVCNEKLLWKKVAILTSCSLLLPQFSIDYHMMRIYLPLFLFLAHNSQNDSDKKMDYLYLITFGILLIPKNYPPIFGYHTSHCLSTAALLIMLIGLLAEGIKQKIKK